MDRKRAFPLLVNMVTQCTSLQVLKVGSTEMATESCLALIQAVAHNGSLSYVDIRDNSWGTKLQTLFGKLIAERSSRPNPNALKTLLLDNNPSMGESARGTSAVSESRWGQGRQPPEHVVVVGCGQRGRPGLVRLFRDQQYADAP